MLCPKCGAENQEGNLFCSKCGRKLVSSNEKQNNILTKIKEKTNLLNNRKNIIISGIILAIIISIVGAIIYLNTPIHKFESKIRDNKYLEAMKIYNEKIKGNSDKEKKITSFLKDEVTKTEKLFANEKLDYDKAKSRLETIKDTGLLSSDVKDSINKINNLNDSRISFKKGEEFRKNGDFINAIKEYNNVIKDDKNYEKAKEQIANNQKKYKEQVLKSSEEYANAKDYDKSVSLIKQAVSVIENDDDLKAKLAVYEKQLEEKKIAEKKAKLDKAKSEQLVIVESSKIIVQDSRYKSIYPDMIQVIVNNKSEKTIKNMEVSCLAYDKNNYPLQIKTQFSFSRANYEFIGDAPNVNIVSGASFGEHVGWKLDEAHGISTVLACVKNVTFYDGTTWNNPYYTCWIEEYKEKQLKQ